MTKTVRFTANTTWVAAATGPLYMTINPVSGFSDIFIGNSAPDANTFLLKPVAGENYMEIELETGDSLYIKARQDKGAIVSWIERVAP